MRRRTALALGVALLLPTAGVQAMPMTMVSGAGMAWYLAGFELGPWQAYLAGRLTPDLEFIDPPDVPEIPRIRIDGDVILPEFARPLLDPPEVPRLSLFAGDLKRTLSFGQSASLESPLVGFERESLLSGIRARVNPATSVQVSAVLASQQFSHSMLDVVEFDGDFRPVDFNPMRHDLSQGAGVQLGMVSELLPRLQMNASYQSRIDMDELAMLRGVHGYSADLDMPPRMRIGMDMLAGEQTVFTVAVSQVFYSDVQAFPSRALPSRFTALLGDSGSPEFAWNDVTMFSLGIRWQHESDFDFRLDFHSRSQPEPSSPMLLAALGEELAQHSVMVGMGKGLGERARFDLSASYAPPEFAFGGNVLGVVSSRLDAAVEVAARLNIRF
ncbi:MAG: hypothetical protein RQ729_07350 [Wenzhouxiangellaceae bacterium]|nr:hypothetical protein [Wenzhouxiangellaceae bacterium]